MQKKNNTGPTSEPTTQATQTIHLARSMRDFFLHMLLNLSSSFILLYQYNYRYNMYTNNSKDD